MIDKVVRNPPTKRDLDVLKRHRKALDISVDMIMGEGSRWLVNSETSEPISYVVLFTPHECHNFSSCLKCRICGICRHVMSCGCEDFAGGHLCKHVHAVMLCNPDLIQQLPAGSSISERRSQVLEAVESRSGENINIEPVAEFIEVTELYDGSTEHFDHIIEEDYNSDMILEGDSMILENEAIQEELVDSEEEALGDFEKKLEAFKVSIAAMERSKKVKSLKAMSAHLSKAANPPIRIPANKKSVLQSYFPKKRK